LLIWAKIGVADPTIPCCAMAREPCGGRVATLAYILLKKAIASTPFRDAVGA